MVFLGLVLLLLVSVAAGVLYLKKPELFRIQQAGSGEGRPRRIVQRPFDAEEKWSRKAVLVDDVKVRIARVEYGAIRAKDERNMVQTSTESNFLQIYLAVENVGEQEVSYRSWYGNTFADKGKQQTAELMDSSGRAYSMMTFQEISRIAGHVDKAELAARSNRDQDSSVSDVLVFEMPEGMKPSSQKYFRLRLPAAACGGNGSFRLEFLGSTIRDS